MSLEGGATSAIERLNAMSEPAAEAALLSICGSTAWARRVAGRRPFDDAVELEAAAESAWDALEEADWMEAIEAHPRIGESTPASGGEASGFSEGEQSRAATSDAGTMERLAESQRAYERRHGFGYLVYAAGRTGEEVLADCRSRLENDRETEIARAAEEERKIGRIRVSKWLEQGGPP